jgi:hypothetical protein
MVMIDRQVQNFFKRWNLVEVVSGYGIESAPQPEATQPGRMKYPGGDEQNDVGQ